MASLHLLAMVQKSVIWDSVDVSEGEMKLTLPPQTLQSRCAQEVSGATYAAISFGIMIVP